MSMPFISPIVDCAKLRDAAHNMRQEITNFFMKTPLGAVDKTNEKKFKQRDCAAPKKACPRLGVREAAV